MNIWKPAPFFYVTNKYFYFISKLLLKSNKASQMNPSGNPNDKPIGLIHAKQNLSYKIVEWEIIEWTKGIQIGIALSPNFIPLGQIENETAY